MLEPYGGVAVGKSGRGRDACDVLSLTSLSCVPVAGSEGTLRNDAQGGDGTEDKDEFGNDTGRVRFAVLTRNRSKNNRRSSFLFVASVAGSPGTTVDADVSSERRL